MRVRDCARCGLPFAAPTTDPTTTCTSCERRNGHPAPPLVAGGQGRTEQDVTDSAEGVVVAIVFGIAAAIAATLLGLVL